MLNTRIDLNTSISDTPTLKKSAPSGVLIGTAVDSDLLSDPDDPKDPKDPRFIYTEKIIEQFNCLTPENDMKWRRLQPRGDQTYDFTAADKIVEFAERNKMIVKGHTLLWRGALPGWVLSISSLEPFKNALRTHIFEVVTHFKVKYPGVVVAWDVVNEAIDDAGSNDINYIPLRPLTNSDPEFDDYLTKGYIADAFRWARQADPQAKLLYNEQNAEWPEAWPGLPKCRKVLQLVRELKAQGLIDGVGFQCHIPAYWSAYNVLQKFADTLSLFEGVFSDVSGPFGGCNISELDVNASVDLSTLPPGRQDPLVEQARTYHDIVQAYLDSGGKQITLWGFTDLYSWHPEWSPCIYDEYYQPKLAYAALRNALRSQAWDASEEPTARWAQPVAAQNDNALVRQMEYRVRQMEKRLRQVEYRVR